jgi:hypothetical protein
MARRVSAAGVVVHLVRAHAAEQGERRGARHVWLTYTCFVLAAAAGRWIDDDLISNNNIATGMVRDGRKIRFRSPKVRFPPTSPKRFLVSPKHSFVIDQFRRLSHHPDSSSRTLSLLARRRPCPCAVRVDPAGAFPPRPITGNTGNRGVLRRVQASGGREIQSG